MNIQNLIYRNTLRTISAHKLQKCAEFLTSRGIESPSLTQLMILESPYENDIRDLFEKAAEELGYAIPTKEESVKGLVRDMADSIVKGELSEYKGAMKIWKEVLVFMKPIPDDLWVFKSEASVIESCLTDFEEHGGHHTETINESKSKIMSAAKSWLSNHRK